MTHPRSRDGSSLAKSQRYACNKAALERWSFMLYAQPREVKATAVFRAGKGERRDAFPWTSALSRSLHQPPDFPVVCWTKFRVLAWKVRPERGWTTPEYIEAVGNCGGGWSQYWRAIRLSESGV